MKIPIVTFNYRVSVLGFLAGDPLKADSTDGSVGNYGLQDMRQAVQFIHETANSWNGNPNRITLYGESAGSGSLSHFLTNPRTWGFYQQAILESGPMADWITFNYSYQTNFLISSRQQQDAQRQVYPVLNVYEQYPGKILRISICSILYRCINLDRWWTVLKF